MKSNKVVSIIGITLAVFMLCAITILAILNSQTTQAGEGIPSATIAQEETPKHIGTQVLTQNKVVEYKDELCSWANALFNKSDNDNLEHFIDCSNASIDEEITTPFDLVRVESESDSTIIVSLLTSDRSQQIEVAIDKESVDKNTWAINSLSIITY